MAKLKTSTTKKARHIQYRAENRAAKNKAKKMAKHIVKFPDYKLPAPLVGNQPAVQESGYLVTGQDAKGRDLFQLVGFDRPHGFYSNAMKKARVDYSIGARAVFKAA